MSPSSISSSDNRRPFFAFAGRVALFLLPLVLFLAGIEAIFALHGENWTTGKAYRYMREHTDTVFGRAYFSQNYQSAKLLESLERSPGILVMGDSRVMQFRDAMFPGTDSAFYNAGGMIAVTEDLRVFRQEFAAQLRSGPTVILGLSPWWFFDRGGEREARLRPSPPSDPVFSPLEHLHAVTSFLGSLVDGTLPLAALGSPGRTWHQGYRYLGFRPHMEGGFRSDGSYLYVDYMREFAKTRSYEDRDAVPIFDRARQFTHQFRLPMTVSEAGVRLFVEEAAQMASDGAEVLVVIPPFSLEVMRFLETSPEHSQWLQVLYEDIPRLLEREGIPCLAVRSPEEYGLDDRAMFDGMHPGEVLTVLMLEDLARLSRADSPLRGVDAAGLIDQTRNSELYPLALGIGP